MPLIQSLRGARLNFTTQLTVAPRSAPRLALIRPLLRAGARTRQLLSHPSRPRHFQTNSGSVPPFEIWSKRAPPGSGRAYSQDVCIYHAGTGRITMIACLKLTTLFMFAFFGFVVTPAYYKQDGFSQKVVLSSLCATVPLVFVGYVTSPFVGIIFTRLPPFARQSSEALDRYLKFVPRQTELQITTISFIGAPRVSKVRIDELVPVKRRFGIVNMTRDTAAENASRAWYMYRAVGNFGAQIHSGKTGRPWAWHIIWAHANKRP
ncbi:putative paired amphipathic helix protein [Rosellinia necatrix]|uniref:Putative paired amphipathic helix protein n=1 Tax=Rosellinia necatrix TaxID=77044 RepID=A0A1W2TKH8_ROSNE|nr:putative paired amphipathic helix protein [Rosellinia necatrix]